MPEYWIADLDARAIEQWKLADGAESPEILGEGERLRWAPVAGGPTLDLPVGEVFAGV